MRTVIAYLRDSRDGHTHEHVDKWEDKYCDSYEADVNVGVLFQWTEGNYGCDCN